MVVYAGATLLGRITIGRGSVIGGCVYFIFAFIPMYLAYSATLIDPAMVNNHINADSQYILPNLILQHTPLAAQVIFFGALLAAIMSCSSATLLAPSVTFAENVLRPFLPKLADCSTPVKALDEHGRFTSIACSHVCEG